jgi:hypothetical protein
MNTQLFSAINTNIEMMRLLLIYGADATSMKITIHETQVNILI